MSDLVPAVKTCRDCGDTKSLAEFYVRTSGYVYPYCRPCELARVKAYQAKQRQREGDEAYRERQRRVTAASRKRRGGETERVYNRARGRALEVLTNRHRAEFDRLLLLARRGELEQ